MADTKNEIDELRKENEFLKRQLNPLTESESSRLKELKGLLASTASSDKKFTDLVKEFTELKSRSRNGRANAYANVGDTIKIGE
jgi:chromosome segregation ATPase